MDPLTAWNVHFFGVDIVVTYHLLMLFGVMGRKKKTLPSRLYHKGSGQDRIIFGGRTIYLGRHDSPESLANYARIVTNISATGEPEPTKRTHSIAEIAARYMEHVRASYGERSGEPAAINRAVDTLVELFGPEPAETFGTAKMIAIQDRWSQNLCVTTANKYHGYLLNLFRWAGMVELIPASVWHHLRTVPKLKPQRSKARDPKTVGPVAWEVVERTLPHVSQTVRDIIMMQWHTGMRTAEVLSMTADQIADGVYRPAKHKNAWRGHVREVPLGPKALAIVASRQPGADGLLFAGYTSASYGRAITRACAKHDIPRWHPHQLRHSVSSNALRTHGVAAARALLGHKSLNMVARYASSSVEDAKRAVEKDG
jgi:integrase